MIDKERVLDLLNRGIDRSDRWIRDAEIRRDRDDDLFYQGQLKVLLEMKEIISKWNAN